MDQVVFECGGGSSCQRLPSKSCSSAGREPLQQWAQGDDDDDDHDACDDEFSSCGQLDPSAEREREEEGFRRGGMEKWTLKNKSRI